MLIEENEVLKEYLKGLKIKETETNIYLDCPICLETQLENSNLIHAQTVTTFV